MNEERKQLINTLKAEIKHWEDVESHDLDFCIEYKDEAYRLYKRILKYLEEKRI